MTISVNIYRNPLQPSKREQLSAKAGDTLRSLTIEYNGGASEWPFPTIALVDGKPWLRGRWNEPLSDGMVIEFKSMLQGGGKATGYALGGLMVVAGILTTIFSAGTGAFAGVGLIIGGVSMIYGTSKMGNLDIPNAPSPLQFESGSPTYSIGAGGNRPRLGEPIPVVYGRFKVRPDLASIPYTYFLNGDQYLAATLAVSQGEIEGINNSNLYFGTSIASNLTDVSIQFVGPTTNLSLFRDIVQLSDAINGSSAPGVSGADQEFINNSPANFHKYGDVIYITVYTLRFPPTVVPVVIPHDVIIAGNIYTEQRFYYFDVNPEKAEVYDYILEPGTPYPKTDAQYVFINAVVGRPVEVTGTITKDGTYTVTGVYSKYLEVDSLPGITEFDSTSNVKGTSDGWSAQVKLFNADQFCDKIEWDIAFPSGLGTVAGDGSVSNKSVTVELRIEKTGGTVLYTESNVITAADVKKPYRVTFSKSVPAGIGVGFDVYCRLRRTTLESGSTAVVDRALWAGLKAYLPNKLDYPVSKLQVLVKASEQLSGDIAGDISVIVQRKLPIWNGTTWSSPTATRSIAWALADILRNNVYGMGLEDNLIDLDALLSLDSIWQSRGDTFDGVFDQTITAWEALQKVARCGRAFPVFVNGKITFVREGAKTLRSAIFTPSNITEGSLSIKYSFRQDSEPDGVDVSYIDTATWNKDNVIVGLPGVATPERPMVVDLFGCTDAAMALREATYLSRRIAYIRKSISWNTELEGRLLMLGDMVALAHDIPSWSKSAEVVFHEVTTGIVINKFTISEPIDWETGSYGVLFKNNDGTVSGPYVIESYGHPTPTTFEIQGHIPFTPNFDLANGDRSSMIIFRSVPKDFIITDISPAGDTGVSITAIPYDYRVHESGA